MEIGDWVRREGRNEAKWHLCESIVGGAAFTKCGRRLERRDRYNRPLEISTVEPLTRMIGQPQDCKRCG